MKENWQRCIELDLKDFKNGVIGKRTLCKYLSDDLDIVAMPYWEFIRMSDIRVKKEDLDDFVTAMQQVVNTLEAIQTFEEEKQEEPKDVEDIIYRIIAYDRENRNKGTTSTDAVDKFKQQIIDLAKKKVDECNIYNYSFKDACDLLKQARQKLEEM